MPASRGALAKPYRIAFLVPEVTLEGPDQVHAREAAALVWLACIEALQRHPGVSVLQPDATPLVPQDGHYAPAGADRGASPGDAVFGPTRRDELLWLELALLPGGKPGVVRLHGRARDGAEQTFDALGRALGEQVQQAFGAWLSARGLALGALPRTLDTLTADDALTVVRAVAPLLAAQARIGGVAAGAASAGTDEVDDEEDPPPALELLDLEAADDAASTSVMMEVNDALILEELTAEPRTTISGRPRAIANRLPASLRVAAIRLLEIGLGDDLSDLVLMADPEHPQALFARYLAARERDLALLRRVLASAPGWARPYAELAAPDEVAPPLPGDANPGSPPTALEVIAATGIAAVCRPASLAVLSAAAERLADDGRVDEGARLLERAVGLHGDVPDAHLALVDLLGRADREGARLAQAMASTWRHGCPMDAALPWYPDQIRVDLRASTALLGVGRLDEAIALRANRLEGREAQWPSFTATLGAWRKDPRFVAWSFAREGSFRGDDARAVEGFGRAEPDDAVDLALFLDALVALGREDEAQLAWAQFGLGARHDAPAARLAAARALFSAGEWRRGLDEMWRVELTCPGRDDQVALARLGLFLSIAPVETVEAALGERLAIGAPTLARRMARDAADFVVGAAKSSVIARALGKLTAVEFDATWLAGFAADTRSKAAIDALFADVGAPRKEAPRPRARAGTPTGGDPGSSNELARADRLVNRWIEAVYADAGEDDAAGIAQAAAYAAANALARYLAMTTQAPSVHAGALRTVAAEALALVRCHRHALADRDARALLGAVDPPLRRADRWVGGAWLGTLERSLGIDERAAGDVAGFAQPHATVASRLLGPEETAVLGWSVVRLHRERPDGWAAACAAQAQRLALHTGRAGADEWAAAVAAQLATRAIDVDEALDALHVACYLAEGTSPVPCVHAARVLFQAGRPPAAASVLIAGLASAEARWRDANVAEIEPLWSAAKLDVPFAFEQVAAGVFAALQAREPARAEKLGRWAVAFDPSNAEAHRNLGLALAQQGKIPEALVHLVRGTREQATQILAGVLSQRDKLPDAMAVLDYASRWYVRADQWLTYGGIAYTAMDNARTVRGYALAWQLDPAAFDPTQLNAYAGVLDEVGDYDTCALIAERLDAAAQGEALWTSSAANHLACARIGQGRFDEAVTLAEEAVATNPLADNTAGFATTLARARGKQVSTPVAAAVVDARGRAREPIFGLLEDGEHAAASALVGAPLASWRVRRAALGATRFRFGSENRVEVTPRARAAALAILADTVGLVDRDAVIARALALEIREQAYFARDPVPGLGDRMTRDAFYAEFRARGGVVLGEEAPPLAPFVDRVVVPGGKVARASDYIALLRDLAAIDPREAIAQFSLDEASFVEVALAWTAAMEADATIAPLIAAGLARGGVAKR